MPHVATEPSSATQQREGCLGVTDRRIGSQRDQQHGVRAVRKVTVTACGTRLLYVVDEIRITNRAPMKVFMN